MNFLVFRSKIYIMLQYFDKCVWFYYDFHIDLEKMQESFFSLVLKSVKIDQASEDITNLAVQFC